MPKLVAFTKDFSQGRTGDLGQYTASDNQYLKDSVNMVSNRAGLLTQCGGTKRDNRIRFDLRANDKVVPFEFNNEIFYFVYDPLFQNKFEALSDALALSINSRVRRYPTTADPTDRDNWHLSNLKNLNALKTLRDRSVDGATSRYRVAGLIYDPKKSDLASYYVSKSLEAITNTAHTSTEFYAATRGLYTPNDYETRWYDRAFIADGEGRIITASCLRPLFLEHGGPDFKEYELPAKFYGDAVTVEDRQLITDPFGVREKYYKEGVGEYEALIRNDSVLFYDKEGVMPTLRWGIYDKDLNIGELTATDFRLVDTRCLYRFKIPSYWSKSALTDKEFTNFRSVVNIDADFKERLERKAIYGVGEDATFTDSGGVVKPANRPKTDAELEREEKELKIPRNNSPFVRIPSNRIQHDAPFEFVRGLKYWWFEEPGFPDLPTPIRGDQVTRATYDGSPIWEKVTRQIGRIAGRSSNKTDDAVLFSLVYNFYMGPRLAVVGGHHPSYTSPGPMPVVVRFFRNALSRYDEKTISVPARLQLAFRGDTTRTNLEGVERSQEYSFKGHMYRAIPTDFIDFFLVGVDSAGDVWREGVRRKPHPTYTIQSIPDKQRYSSAFDFQAPDGRDPNFNEDRDTPFILPAFDTFGRLITLARPYGLYPFYINKGILRNNFYYGIPIRTLYGVVQLQIDGSKINSKFKEMQGFTDRFPKAGAYEENKQLFANMGSEKSSLNASVPLASAEETNLLAAKEQFAAGKDLAGEKFSDSLKRIARNNLFVNLKDRTKLQADFSVDPDVDDSFLYTPQVVGGLEILWIHKTFGTNGKAILGTNKGEIVTDKFTNIEFVNAGLDDDVPISFERPVDVYGDRFFLEAKTGEILYSRYHFEYSGRRQYTTTGQFQAELRDKGGIKKLVGIQEGGFCAFLTGNGDVFVCLITQNTDIRGWFRLQLDFPVRDMFDIDGRLHVVQGKGFSEDDTFTREGIKKTVDGTFFSEWDVYGQTAYNIRREPFFTPIDPDVFAMRSQTNRLDGITNLTSAQAEVKGKFDKVKPYFRVSDRGAVSSLSPSGPTLQLLAHSSQDGAGVSIGFSKKDAKTPIDVLVAQYRLLTD